MEALKTNVLIWMSSSMKAPVQRGPNYLANLEVYKNTNFEEIHCIFKITQIDFWSFLRDSVCEYDSQHCSILDEIGIVSWSSDPVD